MSTVLIDVDDTVCDLLSVWLEVYNCDYSDNLTKNQMTDWDIQRFVKPECGNKIFRYLDDPNLNLYYAIEPMSGALETINILRDEGYKVIFATRIDPFQRKYKWLIEHGFLKNTKDYVVAEDKYLIKSDIMVDDRWSYIEDYKGFGILMDQPHNRKYSYPLRAYNWTDVYNFIIEGEKL